ncbi:MAG: hypothetical protein LBB34_02195, partial [Holosporales bacterium]|nr:hypothetical protein [Holosporales bacterium]
MKLLRVFSDRLFAKRKGSLLKSKDVTEKEHGLYLALIPILWMIMFFVIPVLIIFKISFSTAIFNMPPFSEIFSSTADYLLEIKINFKNYIAAVRNQYYLEAFVNSIKLSTLATAACLFLGFAMAYGIHNAKEKTASTLLLFVSLSFWTS